MKIVLIGLWLTAVALAAAFGAALMGSAPPHGDARAETAAIHPEKTRTINVPIILDGAMQGYVGMQFSYVADPAAKAAGSSPETYLLDAAFNDVYMDTTFDFRHLERIDLPAFTKRLVTEVNGRLGAPVLKDVLVENFNYIPKDVQKD